MRRPLVLTGPPASGKTGCGRRLAESRRLAAFVDVDDVRQLVVAGAAAPWDGAEGERQRLLGARNAISLARGFADAGVEVVVADVLTPATAQLWRGSGVDPLIVHLRIGERAAAGRAAMRPRWITDEEFALLHRLDREHPPAADAVLQVDGMTLEEQVQAAESLWSAA